MPHLTLATMRSRERVVVVLVCCLVVVGVLCYVFLHRPHVEIIIRRYYETNDERYALLIAEQLNYSGLLGVPPSGESGVLYINNETLNSLISALEGKKREILDPLTLEETYVLNYTAVSELRTRTKIAVIRGKADMLEVVLDNRTISPHCSIVVDLVSNRKIHVENATERLEWEFENVFIVVMHLTYEHIVRSIRCPVTGSVTCVDQLAIISRDFRVLLVTWGLLMVLIC